MSARPRDQGHFVRWLRARDASAHDSTFAPRHLYGSYLLSQLGEALLVAPAGSRFDHLRDRATLIEPSSRGGHLHLGGGGLLRADRVVVALGHPPSAGFRGISHGGADAERLVANPWAPAALDLPNSDRPVLIMGTGLTAVDVALALRERGHWGTIHAISRHGILPQAHSRLHAVPTAGAPPPRETTALGLLRHLRAAARAARNWRTAVDALRPHVQEVWLALPSAERRRFLRHLRPYWDAHRHRLPPDAAAPLGAMVLCGALRLIAGRVERFDRDVDGIRVTIADRHRMRHTELVVGHVIDCTGPAPLASSPIPIVQSLVAQGLARFDPLGLGLDASSTGALIGADGRSSRWLFALGPLLKGVRWETTSIPEIREQAAALPRVILESFADPDRDPASAAWRPSSIAASGRLPR